MMVATGPDPHRGRPELRDIRAHEPLEGSRTWRKHPFPGLTTMRVFLSYASEDRARAEEIALALEAQGHDVFFDRTDLSGGDDYNEVIRKRLLEADLFVFLITPPSIRDGSYTLTELRLARDRWPSAHGAVIPVLLEPVEMADVPAYLRSVTIFEPQGNVAAELAALISTRRRRLKPLHWAMIAIGIVALGYGGSRLLRTGEPVWTSKIEESDFLTRYVIPEEDLEQIEYSIDPTSPIRGENGDVVRLGRVAFGTIADTAMAFSVTVVIANTTARPLPLDVTQRFFAMQDDRGRDAELVFFCCATRNEMLAIGQQRELRLIYAGNPAWGGKETGAGRIYFRVSGLMPLASGTWIVPPVMAAAR